MAELPPEALERLAHNMVDDESPNGGWGGAPAPRDNANIPSGYTYFGQFIDHDITFDPVSSAQRANDGDALHNFRSPALDLDSLYGSGPIDEPFQYERGSNGMKFLVEPNRNGVDDLPRNSQDVALIGDPRNDENTIVSQLHLSFLKLHNRVAVDVAKDNFIPNEAKFEEAQRRTRWLYQWVAVNDFVPRIIGDEMFRRLIERDEEGNIVDVKRKYYRPRTQPYMPIEFSGAAFRFGHSMIRGVYDLSSVVTERPIFLPGEVGETDDLRGFRALPDQWTIDWKLFLEGGTTPQPSRLMDTKVVRGLFDLPGGAGSLPLLNLIKGQILLLPSGQDVAAYMREQPLSTAELEGAPDLTPLWFYILKEAEKRAAGKHLGPVGGRIVGEVLLGIVELDKQSWISVSPAWRPTDVPGIQDIDGDGEIGLPDLISFSTEGGADA